MKSGSGPGTRGAKLTLRQIEVVRAVAMTGTIAGAAKMLGVSAPGISRLTKYSEQSLGFKLFERKQNRLVPTRDSQEIFEQINVVYAGVDDLEFVLQRITRGDGITFRLASVPSMSNVMVPLALKKLRERYPALGIYFEIIKVHEAQDHLLLGKCELAIVSYSFDHPAIDLAPLARGELRCIVPHDHPLAAKEVVSAAEVARFPLVGVDPNDPYGRVMTEVFRRADVAFEMTISVRFGVTAIGLVRAGLGISVVDQFAVARGLPQDVKVLRFKEPTLFEPFVATRSDRPLSRHGQAFIGLLRDALRSEGAPPAR